MQGVYYFLPTEYQLIVLVICYQHFVHDCSSHVLVEVGTSSPGEISYSTPWRCSICLTRCGPRSDLWIGDRQAAELYNC